ncbi:hypothetical protein AGABI2DRAFT_190911 [Agaricus bisporus var. bisporus H97]|uniref:hypothetical protein n=1 Tax=Agaricus bisporus var. bisporus (strain H97 / ATCC MYA-4626 / FGSC 10389) TaxID=936046 RepID=UPI00029F654F|nr:hypothetical protein AGABI2DRAFT_190911 [Agaricus bisporus var. bisporus H97]EKV50653.1 hypothetical protein AGABI2DRAFT_190911 [Agaricus bisporus var. bisporus H97]
MVCGDHNHVSVFRRLWVEKSVFKGGLELFASGLCGLCKVSSFTISFELRMREFFHVIREGSLTESGGSTMRESSTSCTTGVVFKRLASSRDLRFCKCSCETNTSIAR